MNTKFSILHIPEVDSTNNFAQKKIDQSNENLCNTAIYTDYQTKGRGAFQNTWLSNKKKNLLLSLIICPDILPEKQFLISKITSLALIKFFANKKIQAKIKWPNDILINLKKVAGILIENSILGNKINNSIIGIGLNLNQTHFPEKIKATSLKNITTFNYNIEKELKKFLVDFNYWLNICLSDDYDKINFSYFRNLIGTNDFFKYKTKNNIFEAIIVNVTDFGNLTLMLKTGKKKSFGFKEVEMIY